MKTYILHPLAIVFFAPIWIAIAIAVALVSIALTLAAIVVGPAAIFRARGAKG